MINNNSYIFLSANITIIRDFNDYEIELIVNNFYIL